MAWLSWPGVQKKLRRKVEHKEAHGRDMMTDQWGGPKDKDLYIIC